MANKKLNAVITIGGAVASTLIGSIDKTKGKLNEVGQALRKLEAEQRKMGNTNAAAVQQIDRLRAAQERLLSVEKARTANQEKQRQLRQQFSDTAMVGAAIALPTVALFGKAAQFNYDLQVIGNTANMTSEQIKQMGINIVKTSDETGQSAETIKNATGFLIAAGQGINQVNGNIRTIGRTSTAAAAEIEDVAKASFVLGDALKIGEGQAMQDAMDALVQSGKEGNFEFKAMAQELPVLAGAFQALKFTGQEAVASMGAYLQIARKGAATESEAANNFNNFLAKILSPETLKKAEKLGGNLYGVVKKAQDSGKNPIDAAIAEINRITKGGDQKLLGELFADMQVQNFVRPALQNISQYEEIKAKALNSRGVVDKDFATMMATDKMAIDELKNSFAGLGKTIGDSVAPVLKSVAVAITPVVRAARDFVAANPQLVGGLIVAAGAFTTLRMAIIGTRLAAAMLGGKLLNISALGARVQASMALAGGALPKVAAGVRAIGLAFSATGIGALITGVAMGAVAIYRHWDGVKAFFVGTFEGISTGMQPVIQVFKDFFDSMSFLKPVIDAIGSGLSSVWQWFTSLTQPVQYTSEELKKAGEAGKTFGELLAAGISLALTPLTLLIEGITWINNNIGAVIGKLNEFGSAVGGKAFEAVQKVKSFFGSDDAAAPAAVPAGRSSAVPALPAMATAKGGGNTVTDSSQNTFNIYQQPGQDQKKLAEEIARQQEQRRKVLQRGALYDGAMAQ